MHFIVSTNTFTDEYNHVFSIDKQGVKRIKADYMDELYPASFLTFNFQFPWELVDKILFYILNDYISTRNYSLAIELLLINKLFMKTFYDRHFTVEPIPTRVFVKRLASLFHLMHDIWYTLTEFDFPFMEMYSEQRNIKGFYVWNYEGEIDIFHYGSPPALVSNRRNIDYEHFRTGPKATDMVILCGTYSEGIIKSTYIRTPALYLRFADCNQQVMPTYKTISNCKNWKSFGRLLRQGLGSSTAVLVEVRQTVDLPDETVFTDHIVLEI